jgi:hypothetical protein
VSTAELEEQQPRPGGLGDAADTSKQCARGRVVEGVGKPVVVGDADRGLGLGGIAAGTLVLAITAGHIAGLVTGVVVAAVGLGVAAVAATSLGTRVSDDLTGSATGLLNTAAQLGTTLGVAALVTIASLASPPTGTAIAWTAGAATADLSGLIMLTAGTGGECQGLRADLSTR